jgi:hypothetical protein
MDLNGLLSSPFAILFYRMYQQRFITAIIIIILVLLIGFIVWGKLRR